MAMSLDDIKFETKNMKEPMLAYVTVTYQGLIVKGIRVYHKKEDPSSLFISMPSDKGSNNKYYDNVYFKDQSKKEEFEKKILAAWEKNNK